MIIEDVVEGIFVATFILGFSLSFDYAKRYSRIARGWAPLFLFVAVVASQFLPETGFSDIRSQWHHDVWAAILSVIMLFAVFFIHKDQNYEDFVFSLVLAASATCLFDLSVVHLVVSWDFFHRNMR